MFYFISILFYSFIRALLPKQKINGWSLESNITAIFHQGIILPLLLGLYLCNPDRDKKYISLLYSTTFAYLFTGLYESFLELNYIHIAHHSSGLILIGLMEFNQNPSLWWWGAICTATLEIGGLGLSIVDLYPTNINKRFCFWLYGCSRCCVCIILWNIYCLLPTLISVICVSIPSLLLVIHNLFVLSQLWVNY
tara:strand:- start:54 stop:635 length:582 start_codon:yes stop_codon:yes gene_type:complete